MVDSGPTGPAAAGGGFGSPAGVLTALARLEHSTESADQSRLEDTVRRAAAACYAIEGIYPPDVAYLEEHYGIRIDWARYTVDYQVFASNLMPDITVLRNGAE